MKISYVAWVPCLKSVIILRRFFLFIICLIGREPRQHKLTVAELKLYVRRGSFSVVFLFITEWENSKKEALFAWGGGGGRGQFGRALRALDLQSRGPEFNTQHSVYKIFSTVLFPIHLLGHACKLS